MLRKELLSKITVHLDLDSLFGYRPTAGLFRDTLCTVLDSAISKGAMLLDVEGGLDFFQSLSSFAHTSQPGPPIVRLGVHVGPKNPDGK